MGVGIGSHYVASPLAMVGGRTYRVGKVVHHWRAYSNSRAYDYRHAKYGHAMLVGDGSVRNPCCVSRLCARV
uniref:Uncharacterized protein n=1 Tax=Arundo donax TaxID=35708 RepID=A0A0A9FKN0_ARUDO